MHGIATFVLWEIPEAFSETNNADVPEFTEIPYLQLWKRANYCSNFWISSPPKYWFENPDK